MTCKFQLVNATLNMRPTQNEGQICGALENWYTRFYGNFMDGFCFKVIFLSYEDMKTPCYISFTESAKDFTSNNFLKCVQVKKLKCVTLFSYGKQ